MPKVLDDCLHKQNQASFNQFKTPRARETERETETDRMTETDRVTDRQTHTHTNTHTHTPTNTHPHPHTPHILYQDYDLHVDEIETNFLATFNFLNTTVM